MSKSISAQDLRDKTVLEERVQLKIAVIGCGNAGSQIAVAAMKERIDNVFVINSSAKDLNDTIVDDAIPSFIIGRKAQGAGRRRDVAKALLRQNGKELFREGSEFMNICKNSDIIFVATSTSGGTGSGISPSICKKLKTEFPNQIIVFYGILPRITDSTIALFNASECMNEIEELQIPYLATDLDYYEHKSNDFAYEKVVEKMADDIATIAGKYLNHSQYSMIDENDMRSIIDVPGYASVYSVDKISQADLDKESMQSMLIKKIKHSPAAEIARDGIISQMGIIGNFPQDMDDVTKAGDYTELNSFVGVPMTTYENYAVTNGSAFGQISIILTGQSLPVTKMEQMSKICDAAAEKQRMAEKNKKSLESIRSKETSSFLGGFASKNNKMVDEEDEDDSFFD